MRERIVFHLNGTRLEVGGAEAFMTLSDFLRYRRRLTGTKVVCAEGDCGACTLLVAASRGPQAGRLKSVNSCISFVFQMDGHQVVTVEGYSKGDDLHPAQQSMIENFGAQCGFCTPGFVGSLAFLAEDSRREKFPLTEKKCRNYLTGNLCRCTGYSPILNAAQKMDCSGPSLHERYRTVENSRSLKSETSSSLRILHGAMELFLPTTLAEAVELRRKHSDLRIVAGATDLGVLINKNRMDWTRVMSLQNIDEMHEIQDLGSSVRIGARITLDRIESELTPVFPEFGRLLHIFASPQIKNSATLVGNVLNASPIGDGLPFLMAAEAVVHVSGTSTRTIPLSELYTGYKTLSIKPDEIVTGLEIPKLSGEVRLYKASTRKDLDISAVTFAAYYEMKNGSLTNVRIAVGGVAATVQRQPAVETSLEGKPWSEKTFSEAAQILRSNLKPLSDVRGTSDYRLQVAGNFLLKMFHEKSPTQEGAHP